MRIGINLLFLIPNHVGGTETYSRGLLGGLAEIDSVNEYYIYLNVESHNIDLPKVKNFNLVKLDISAMNRARRYAYEQFVFPFVLRKHKIDILHSLGYVGPVFPGCKHIITIHDLNFIGHGKHMPKIRKNVLHFMVRQLCRRCYKIVTVSNFSKHEILKNIKGVKESDVVVTYEACKDYKEALVDIDRMKDFPQKYITAFGSLSRHKNLDTLLSAFDIARTRLPEVKLVLMGHLPTDKNRLYGLIDQLGLREDLYFTGFISDGEVKQILSKAILFVFPSLYEGFGLPVLEAQSEGTCVLASNVASLPEVGGDSVEYFEPLSVSELADKITRLMDESRREYYIRKGYSNVKRFKWENTAKATLLIYSNNN